jgi:putative nucleotidyltransferase with HDIG domain
MNFPQRRKALEILSEAEKLNPGPWVEHSKNVALCAEAIANECEGLDGEKAYILGLLHDIGRRAGKGQLMHVYYGWKYMLELGYTDVAQVCLSHSYNTHDMKDDMAVCDISTEQYNDLVNALNECVYDEYDLLIQLCDSIAMAEGVVDICERMSDIKKRYGSYPQAKWDRNLELLEYFSKKVNGNLYEICRR